MLSIKFQPLKLKNFFLKLFTFLSIFSFIVLLIVIFTPLANWLAAFFFVKPNLQKADAIVVLSGGSYRDSTLTLSTLGREIDGIILYKEGWAKKLIFVGNSHEHRVSDAQKMKKLAIKLGVPEEDVLVGEYSTNTYQNLSEAAEIMKKNNFKNTLLVTSSIHTKRSVLIAQKLGLELIPASFSVDQYRQVSVDRLTLFWYEAREIFAIIVSKFKGWI